MEFSRRGFLNLLGIAGVAAAARPAISLFGSDEESGVIVPDSKLTSGHFVVKPKRFLERLPEEERLAAEARANGRWGSAPWGANGDARVVGRIVKNREPVNPHLIRNGYLFASPMAFEGMTVEDAHSSFYVASHDMREKFALFTRQTLSQVDKELRPMATIVTIVDAPIHARPVGLRSPRDEDEARVSGGWMSDAVVTEQDQQNRDERGFDVVATFRQFVVLGAKRSEVTTYETYSEHGEYPVEVPRDIEMGMLVKLDREVVARGETQTHRVAGLLSRFTRSWGSA